MARIEVTDLTASGVLADADLLIVRQSGDTVDKKALMSSVSTYVLASINSDDITEGSTNLFLTGAERTKLTNTTGTNSGDQNIFSTIAVAGQTDVTAGTTTDTATFVAGTNMTITTSGNSVTFNSSGAGGGDVVDDTTPQLGGNLDVNGNSIVSATNGDIAITPNGTGSIVLDGLNWPQADGTADYVLKTDGAGQLSWTANSGSGASQLSELSDVDATVASPSDGDILVYRSAGSDWVLEAKPAGGSNPALGDVTDVTITTVADNEVLAYNNATSEWINQTPAEAGLAEATHTHATTDITSGTFADARIAQSNVTQHQAALSITESQISDLGTYLTASSTNTLTNKTFDANGTGNSISNIETADIATASKTGSDTKIVTGTEGSTNELAKWNVDGDLVAATAADIKPTEFITVPVSDETTALTTGTSKITFRMPYAFTLTDVRASVGTAPVGSTLTVDINEGGTTILSTKLTIDAGEKTSTTAATAAVISDSALADDAEITIDIDQIGSSTAGAGLKVTLIGTRA